MNCLCPAFGPEIPPFWHCLSLLSWLQVDTYRSVSSCAVCNSVDADAGVPFHCLPRLMALWRGEVVGR